MKTLYIHRYHREIQRTKSNYFHNWELGIIVPKHSSINNSNDSPFFLFFSRTCFVNTEIQLIDAAILETLRNQDTITFFAFFPRYYRTQKHVHKNSSPPAAVLLLRLLLHGRPAHLLLLLLLLLLHVWIRRLWPGPLRLDELPVNVGRVGGGRLRRYGLVFPAMDQLADKGREAEC